MGVDGIVTMEDLVEEIVGDIFDEYDQPVDQSEAVINQDGSFVVDGGVLVADLAEEHGVSLPEGEYDTIAGFILSQLGHLPIAGEALRFKDLELEVAGVHQNRVTKVALRRIPNHTIEQETTDTVMVGNGSPEVVPVSDSSLRSARISQLS
jgi:putative hemolysin